MGEYDPKRKRANFLTTREKTVATEQPINAINDDDDDTENTVGGRRPNHAMFHDVRMNKLVVTLQVSSCNSSPQLLFLLLEELFLLSLDENPPRIF